jgi:hypothetical protein
MENYIVNYYGELHSMEHSKLRKLLWSDSKLRKLLCDNKLSKLVWSNNKLSKLQC